MQNSARSCLIAALVSKASGGQQAIVSNFSRAYRLTPSLVRSLNTNNRNQRPSSVLVSARNQSTTRANLAQALSKQELTASAEDENEENINRNGVRDSHEPVEGRSFERNFDTPEVHNFTRRHLGPRESDIELMLAELNYKSLDELIDETIPDDIRFNRPLRLPAALSEHELIEELARLGSLNEPQEGEQKWRSFIGMGYYKCVTPAVIMRNMFENPGWTTAYTAYQAEIAQGRLESLMNYQTMVSELTGLDVANASLLDEATAAAEAMQVCLRKSSGKRKKFLISSRCHPQTKAVVETRAKPLGVQVDYFDELALNPDQQKLSDYDLREFCGLLVQYPNTNGHLYELNAISKACKEASCQLVAATDLLACTIFKPPGDFEYPADIAIGSCQRLGVPLNYGGPHAGFMACKQSLLRLIPGRVVGLTRDSNGRRAYRFALQTREQHIRRDRATSNICTAQALLANMSAMYAVYHGPEGLSQIANSIHKKTQLLAELLASKPEVIEIQNADAFFDTLTIRVASLERVRRRAQESRINLRYYGEQEATVGISLDELTKLSDVFRLASLFGDGSTQESAVPQTGALAKSLERKTSFLQHPVFNNHRSEAQLVRYMKSLENKDISLAHSMIPLGSCTMKLNATSQMLASSWPQFADCHPFQPAEQCKGYEQLFKELDEYLCEITGYDKISFQPNSGAQGEYAGLRVIKSYLEAIGQPERNVCLIPISAHGTNPASAQMAGFKIQTIKVTEEGEIDLEDLRKNVAQFGKQLACLMITYPSTFGVFEDNVRLVCDLIHEAGGQVYLDGANMNAQVGLCRPGDYGSDVSHLNLHKTFCIPHGGGGPGAGPIGVKRHLIPFLPSHPLAGEQGKSLGQSFGSVSASEWGSPAILPISWSYIRLMSSDLQLSSQVAILNANYMRKRLENDYKILFRGAKGNVAHEFIIDCRPFKKSANIEAIDIAKRLQDFGLHAPTVSWPVTNTLMVEPTESEDKQQLDRYCDSLLAIRREIRDIESGKLDKLDNPIKNAPHTQELLCAEQWHRPYTRQQAAFPVDFVTAQNKVWPTVGRVDDTYGDTNLFCTCPPPENKL